MSEAGSASESKKADPRKDKARELWERLAKSRPGPDNKDLIYLARFVPLLATAAIKTLLNRKLTIEELKELIQHAPKAKELATKRALELGPDEIGEEDLRFIVTQTRSVDAAKMLLKRFPFDTNLGLVERSIPELLSAIEKMRSQPTTSSIMKEIDRVL
jgi:hypothetical protein